jgi:hypothetical protein
MNDELAAIWASDGGGQAVWGSDLVTVVKPVGVKLIPGHELNVEVLVVVIDLV